MEEEAKDLSLKEILQIADAAMRHKKEDEIIDWLDTHRRSINRVLNELVSRGAIVCDMKKLEDYFNNKK